jgi:hypothetical protein
VWQKTNRRAAAEKTVRKIEAEAIAFVVAQTIDLSTGRALSRGSWKALTLENSLHPACFKAADASGVVRLAKGLRRSCRTIHFALLPSPRQHSEQLSDKACVKNKNSCTQIRWGGGGRIIFHSIWASNLQSGTEG